MDSTLKELWNKFNIEVPILFDEPMKNHTTFRIGGKADAFISPSNLDELTKVMEFLRSNKIPVFFLGQGANILVSDKGISGAVLNTEKLNSITHNQTEITASAGLSISEFCQFAAKNSLGGVENFYAMPGRIGGSVYMNARCYDRSISDVLKEVQVMTQTGEIVWIKNSDCQFDYKKSVFQENKALILNATFALTQEEPAILNEKMNKYSDDRIQKGHFLFPCAGSMFKNDRSFGMPTGQIIDSLGLKGFAIGDAAIADFHANIFINKGNATASQMKELIELTIEKVKTAYGFTLEPEVIQIGF